MGILDFKLRNSSIINESAVSNTSETLVKSLLSNFPIKVEELALRVNAMLNTNLNEPTEEDLAKMDILCDDIIGTMSIIKAMLAELKRNNTFDPKVIVSENYKLIFLNKERIIKEGLDRAVYAVDNHPLFSWGIDGFISNFNRDKMLHPSLITPAELSKIDKYSSFAEYILLFNTLFEAMSLIYKPIEYAKLNKVWNEECYITREYMAESPRVTKSSCDEDGIEELSNLFDALVEGLSAAKKAIYELRSNISLNTIDTENYLDIYRKIQYTIYNQFCLSAILFKRHIDSILNKKHYYEAVVDQLEKIKKFIESDK